MSNIRFSKLTVDYACIGDCLFLSCRKIKLSELGKSDFLISAGKLFCVSDLNACNLTGNGTEITKINHICVSDLCRSESTTNSDIITKVNCIGTSNLSFCKSNIDFCIITKINLICACDFCGSKLRRDCINVCKLLRLCANNGCLNNLTLDSGCIKNLRLSACNLCLFKLSVNYGDLVRLNCLCASDSCFNNLALDRCCIENLRLCMSNFCLFKLSVNSRNVTDLYSICASNFCSGELTVDSGVITNLNRLCASNLCSSKLCIDRINAYSILRICANDGRLNNSALDFCGIKNLGLCVCNSRLIKLAFKFGNLTNFNLTCASNVGLGKVTLNRIYRLNSHLLCMSKLNAEKLCLYGRNVLYALFRKLSLDIRSEIVVLDNLRHVVIVCLLGFIGFRDGFYAICNGSDILCLFLSRLFLINGSNNCLGGFEHRIICYGIFIFNVYNTGIGISYLGNSLDNLAINVTGLAIAAHEDEYGTYNCGMTFGLGSFLCLGSFLYRHSVHSGFCTSRLFCSLDNLERLNGLSYGSFNCGSYRLFYLFYSRLYGSLNLFSYGSFLGDSCRDYSCALCILVDTSCENFLRGLLYLLLSRCFCCRLGIKYGSSLYCSLGSRSFLNYSCRDNSRPLYVLSDATGEVNLFRLLCLLCLSRCYCSFGSRSFVLFCFGNDSGAISILINTRIKSEVNICFCLCIGNGFSYGCFVLLCFLCALCLVNGSRYNFFGNKHKTINYILVTFSSLGYYLSEFLVINYANSGSIGSSFCYRCLCESGCFSCLYLLGNGCFRCGLYLFCRKCEELNAGILYRSFGGFCLLFYRCFGCLFYLFCYGSRLCINGLGNGSFLHNSCGDNLCTLYVLGDTLGEATLLRLFCLGSFLCLGFFCYGSSFCHRLFGSLFYSLGSFLCGFYLFCYGSRLSINGLGNGSFLHNSCGDNLCTLYVLGDTLGEATLLRLFCLGSFLCLGFFCYGSSFCLVCLSNYSCAISILKDMRIKCEYLVFFYSGSGGSCRSLFLLLLRGGLFLINGSSYGLVGIEHCALNYVLVTSCCLRCCLSKLFITDYVSLGVIYYLLGSRLCLGSFCYGSFGSLGFGLFYRRYVDNLYISSLGFSYLVNLNLCLLSYGSIDGLFYLFSYGSFGSLCIRNGYCRYCCFGGSRGFLYYSTGNNSGAFRILMDTAGKLSLSRLLSLFCLRSSFSYGSFYLFCILYDVFDNGSFFNNSCRDNSCTLNVLVDTIGKINLFCLLSLLGGRNSRYYIFDSGSFSLLGFGNDSGAISILIDTRIEEEGCVLFCLNSFGSSFCYGSLCLFLSNYAFYLINRSRYGVKRIEHRALNYVFIVSCSLGNYLSELLVINYASVGGIGCHLLKSRLLDGNVVDLFYVLNSFLRSFRLLGSGLGCRSIGCLFFRLNSFLSGRCIFCYG